MTANYKLADLVVEISSVYEYVHEMCKEYKTDEPAEFFIKTTQADCDNERRISALTDEKEGHPVRNFPDDYLETLAVYRKIAEAFIGKDIILFHGSVIAVDGQAYLLTAKSGTGKSTHAANWRKVFGERAVMINDDKPLIRISEDGNTVYGTPWNGKHKLGTNTSAPLKAVCILTRSSDNHIEKTALREHYNIILQQVYRMKDPLKLKKTLELIDRLFENTELYLLGCNMDPESAEVAYNGMKG